MLGDVSRRTLGRTDGRGLCQSFVFRGLPTRVVNLYNVMWYRYTILVGNSRFDVIVTVYLINGSQLGLSLGWGFKFCDLVCGIF